MQVSEEEARADAAVDLVLGNNQKRQIVTALDAYFEGRTFDDVLADVEKEQYEELEVSTVLEHTRASVKVPPNSLRILCFAASCFSSSLLQAFSSDIFLRRPLSSGVTLIFRPNSMV